MKLWTDRFKPFVPFHVARREAIQNKWNNRRNGNNADRGSEAVIFGGYSYIIPLTKSDNPLLMKNLTQLSIILRKK
jgi:hypothetical protein